MGDFNENVYEGNLAQHLLHEDIRMSKLCQKTTGSRLPNTHIRGSVPIDAVFATAGILCTAVTLLPHRMGVGDHRVFLLDIESDTLLVDVFPRVIPISRRLLNCASDKIKNTYISVLNQLTSRHLIHKKLLYIHYVPFNNQQRGKSDSNVRCDYALCYRDVSRKCSCHLPS